MNLRILPMRDPRPGASGLGTGIRHGRSGLDPRPRPPELCPRSPARIGRALWVVGLLVGLLVLPAAAVGSGQTEVIVLFGTASPDTNGVFTTFTQPALSDGGQVAFVSMLSATLGELSDNAALYRSGAAGLTVVARKGVTMLDGDLINNFVNNSPSINNAGFVSHSADRASAPLKYVSFLGDGGAPNSFLHVDSASPSGNNQLVSHSTPVINNAGVAAYRAVYGGVSPETGIYSRTSGGTTTLRLLQGVDAPRGGTVLSIIGSLPTLNEIDQIALIASVDDGQFTRKSVMRLDGTTINELARDGDVLGSVTVANISSLTVPINGSGQTAFAATYLQQSTTLRGVFRTSSSGVSLVTPTPLPQAPAAIGSLHVVDINNVGKVAFSADFIGGSDPVTGVYLTDGVSPTLVALEDTATPEGNKYFRRFLNESISLNQNGQVAFLAELSDTPNGPFSGRGIFRYDPASGLEQVIRTGNMLSGSTVTGLGLTGTTYRLSQTMEVIESPDFDFSGFNNPGQIAFNFSYAGGTGIALWSPTAGPVPGDYNQNGVVDAADYTVWRNHLGQTMTLPNEDPDTTPGLVTEEDYQLWKSRFGQTAGSGAGSSLSTFPSAATVPEPTTWLLLAVAGVTLTICRRRKR